MSFPNTKFEIRWYNSLRGRLFLIASFLVLFFSTFIYWFFPNTLERRSISSVEEKVGSLSDFIAYSIAPSLYFLDPKSAVESIEAARKTEEIEYLVIEDTQGMAYASFGDEIAKQVAYRKHRGIVTLKANEIMVVGKEIKVEGEVLGMVYMGHSLKEVFAQSSATRRWIAGLCIGFFVIGLGFVYFATGVTTRNLSKIVRVVNEASDDNLDVRAHVTASDEVGMLARRFNEMLERLSRSVQAQKAREIQYRRLAENMNEGLMRLSPSGELLFANPKLYQMFEADNIVHLKAKIDEVVNQKFGQDKAIDIFEPGESSQVELEVRSANKGTWWVLLSYATFSVGPNSDDKEFIGIFTDITKLKKTESDLIYKNRELDTFVYKASHDLKAPLSSLRGLVDIAKMELKEPEADQYLGLIDRTIGKMDEVLLGLLEVTWIKQGAMEMAEIEFRDLISEILRAITHAQGFNAIEIKQEIPNRFCLISDFKLLSSVMQNLIHNAIKYHHEEGQDRWVCISARSTEMHHILSVKDNGPGIPPEAQERLFDMFFRASNKSKGSGLGLYIVKNSIEKIGGSVELHSKVGSGTEFIINIPVRSLANSDHSGRN